MAADGTPLITWHGKVFAATTEIVKLGQIETSVQVPTLDDPWLRRFIAGLAMHERVEGASRIAPAHLLEMAACRYLEKGGTVESWNQYETELGVEKSKTRPPRSVIQPFMKWARGGRNDTDGSISRLSAAFDAWLALGKERPDPTPRNGEPGTSELADWLSRNHGYQAVADAYDDRLEYEAALKRGAVWVTHANGTERVYDSKAAAECANGGSAHEEPAEWWDLAGCEPTGPGEYLRIDPETDEEDEDNPLPERIKEVVLPKPPHGLCPDLPEYHHGVDRNYSESESGKLVIARRHHAWEYATHNRKYALGMPRPSEEWYSPPRLFQAMECTFDLDPASPGAATVDWIPAKRHFTFLDDGLKQDWGNDFVWLHPPYTKQNLPIWLEKFRQHGNGVCLTVDRTSARWWQELCANADLILQVNKKIQFLRPPDDPIYSSPALGHTLVAYGPRGVAALRNAARNGLGTLFVPFDKSEARIAQLEREIDDLKARIGTLDDENAALTARG